MPSQEHRYDVFLSHNSADKLNVQVIADHLREAGLDPFLDIWHLIPGTPWQEGIEAALASSATAAVFVGPSGISPWHNEEMHDALDRAVRSRDDYRVIPVLLPGASEESVSRFLARRVWVDFRAGLDDDEALQRLVAGIKGEAIDPGAYRLPDEPAPYRGLLPFEAEHGRFFFGRDADVQRLVDKLAQHSFVAVVGASGSGKSSLVKAGLLPRLKANGLPDSARWHVLTMTPGSQPLRSLASQLATLTPPNADRLQAADALTERLQTHPDGLLTAVAAYLADAPKAVLIFVDQFEELFTHCQEGPEHCRMQVEQFVANLVDAVQRGNGQVQVLITLRADFLDRCLAFSDLRVLLEDRQLLLGPLDEPAMREAIMQPAQAVGALFEKGLVEIMLRDIGSEPGMLPLLQQALYELWLRRRGPWLTLEAYEQSGGVLGALQKRADDTYRAMTPAQQDIARSIFLRLIALGEGVVDTRRRVHREELYPVRIADPAQVDAVLQALSSPQARLVVVDDNTVEVAHEALIQRWSILRGWLEDNRDALRVHHRLSEAAQEWEEGGRDESYLYRGAQLAEAESWISGDPDQLNSQEQAFLSISLAARDRDLAEREVQRLKELEAARALAEEQERRIEGQSVAAARLRHRARLLALALIIALAGVVAAVFFWRNADQNAELAQQQLALLKGEQLLREARAKTAFGDVEGAIANLKAAVEADPSLGLDLDKEIADVRRQIATRLVQEGEHLAAAGKRQDAAAKFKSALELKPPPDTLLYVWIPPGELVMGSSEDDPLADDDELPQHLVRLDGFWIMRTEVTNAQYRRCVEAQVCTHPDNARWDKEQFAKQPVTNVNWDQAREYAEWVGGRLPTEAEWEKACRGTDGRIYPWGDNLSADLANVGPTIGTWTDVGSYPPGANGLYDMAGNVWEWTADWYDPSYYSRSPERNPKGPSDGEMKVLRGGSFEASFATAAIAGQFRCAFRGAFPRLWLEWDGFRVVSTASYSEP